MNGGIPKLILYSIIRVFNVKGSFDVYVLTFSNSLLDGLSIFLRDHNGRDVNLEA